MDFRELTPHTIEYLPGGQSLGGGGIICHRDRNEHFKSTEEHAIHQSTGGHRRPDTHNPCGGTSAPPALERNRISDEEGSKLMKGEVG
ncbi:hypothetical protein EVAR_33683_1 [Eumeta japonica]|uniref:Uncharacterized protein n=1 Tax=Eumeta variegata TaxID=151549 RepID=A0A4C1VP10_EUMVA|nr:hypothetical protein EVAR_33683_1 [Eumeta japonica]